MQNVRHDNRAQRAVGEWYFLRVGHDSRSRTEKDLGCNQVRNESLAISCAGPQFQYWSFARWKFLGEHAVPLIVNGS